MKTSMIMVYAGRLLERRRYISAVTVQKYMIRQPEVDLAIPIENIERALGLLVTGGFLDIVEGDLEGSIYRRYIPDYLSRMVQ